MNTLEKMKAIHEHLDKTQKLISTMTSRDYYNDFLKDLKNIDESFNERQQSYEEEWNKFFRKLQSKPANTQKEIIEMITKTEVFPTSELESFIKKHSGADFLHIVNAVAEAGGFTDNDNWFYWDEENKSITKGTQLSDLAGSHWDKIRRKKFAEMCIENTELMEKLGYTKEGIKRIQKTANQQKEDENNNL